MYFSKRKISYLRNRNFLPVSYQTSITKQQEHISATTFIKDLLKGHWFGVLFVVFAATLSTCFDFAYSPFFSQWFVRILTDYSPEMGNLIKIVAFPFAMMMLFWIIPDIIWRIASWYYSKIFDPTLDAKIKITYLNRILKNSYEYFTTHATGYSLSSLYKILFSIKCILKKTTRELIPQFATCMIMLFSICFVHWSLTIIMGLFIAIYVSIFVFSYKKINFLQAKAVDAYSKNTSNITDVIMNFASILLFSRKKFEMIRERKFQDFESKRQQVSNLFLEKLKILRVIFNFLLCGIIFFIDVFYLYNKGIITLADIVYAISANGEILCLIGLLQEDILDLIADFGSVQQGINIMNEGKIAETFEGKNNLLISQGKIEIKNLDFDYGNHQLFKNQNLIINAKEKIGLVGRSGAGKTTLINLILRNLSPKNGQILIDGKDIALISDESLKQNISVVSQNTTLFNRSVLENIKYSKPDATMDEIIEAAKKANAHDFIMNLDYGYNTNVGEQGMRLSGGQRQRILIARAILKNAPILILDEATSALDAENEKFIQESLNTLMIGKTVIAIAHKLNTLKKMDKLIVLQTGKIIEQGTHDELMIKENGLYKDLWNIQREAILMDE